MVVKTADMLVSEIVNKVYAEMGQAPNPKAIETSEEIVKLLVESQTKENKLSEDDIVKFVKSVLSEQEMFKSEKDIDELKKDTNSIVDDEAGKSYDPDMPEWFKYTRVPYYGVERLARLVAELSIFVTTAVAIQFIISIVQRPYKILESASDPKIEAMKTKMQTNAQKGAEISDAVTGGSAKGTYEDRVGKGINLDRNKTENIQLKEKGITETHYNFNDVQTKLDMREMSVVDFISEMVIKTSNDVVDSKNTDKVKFSEFANMAKKYNFNLFTRWTVEFTFGINHTNLNDIKPLIEIFTNHFDYDGLDITLAEDDLFNSYVSDISNKELTIGYYNDMSMLIHNAFISDILANMGNQRYVMGYKEDYVIPQIALVFYNNINNEVLRYEFDDCVMSSVPNLTTANESAIQSSDLYFEYDDLTIIGNGKKIYSTKQK